MTLLEPPTADSLASRLAEQNFRSNVAALHVTQPTLTFEAPPDLRWLFGRDGSLTPRSKIGQWWAGCSLPLRAGAAMLKKLDVKGVVACMLAPTHAAQVAAALAKLTPQQALIVLQPDEAEARVMMSCHDFSTELRQHRLWLATGPDWPTTLRQLFDDRPGLPVPSQFVRLPVTSDDVTTPLISAAEKIFVQVTAARAHCLAHLARRRTGKWLLVAPASFRLWDDAGHAMITALGAQPLHLDPDDPPQSSSLGLAIAAAESDVLLVPDRARAELPSTFPADLQVITWITHPRIPPFDPQYPGDALMLADEDWLTPAHRAGWPANRVALAQWPTLSPSTGTAACNERSQSGRQFLALLADTHPLDTPTSELELSSHHVVWDAIRAELLSNPFALGDDPAAYLDHRRAKLGIAAEGFNREFFLARLVIPAYQQAVVRLLLDNNLPLKLQGRGWDGFALTTHGPITGRDEFFKAAEAGALIFPGPVRHAHAIEALRRPVLWPQKNEADLIRAARQVLTNGSIEKPSTPLCAETVRGLINV